MTLATQLALFVVLAVVAAVLVRFARRAGPLVPASPAVQAVVHGLALGGPWLLYFEGLLPTSVGPTVPLALSWALYALTLLLVGLGTGRCGRASPANQ